MEKVVVIKIGTSLLTTEEGTIRISFLGDLCEDLVKIQKAGWNPVLVSSGAMASGKGLINRISPEVKVDRSVYAAVGQPFLMKYYADFLGVHNTLAAQCLLTWNNFENEQERKVLKNNLDLLLENKIIPIVNENDLVCLEEIRSGDNDVLSAKVAALLGAEKLLILSDVDGLFTDNPHKNPEAKKISEVSHITEEVKAYAGPQKTSMNSLGGMKSKINAAEIATQNGIDTVIFKGLLGEYNIPEILINNKSVGTLFHKQ